LVYQGAQTSTQQGGRLDLLFPYRAGIWSTSGCTRSDIERIGNFGGGVQISIASFQVPLCWEHYSARFSIRPKTNPNTRYDFYANGNIVRVIGTVGGLMSLSPDTTAIALSAGTAEIETRNGIKANIVGGQMAIASSSGIRIIPAPSASFRVVGSQILTSPTNRVLVNGVPTRDIQPAINNTVEITTLANVTRIERLRQWPKEIYLQKK
jgi:hypothetical protein